MKRYRKLLCALLACLFFALPFCAAATDESRPAGGESGPSGDDTEFLPNENDRPLPMLNHCTAGSVCNGETGEIFFSVNGTETVYPAATVKLMTALLALEHYAGRYETLITVPKKAVEDAEGQTVGLKEGERLTVRQLLACLIIANANDAALVLARSVSGSVSAFVEAMNTRAAELGMTATVYRNPTGLHHKQMVTTAEDTLKLAAAVYRQSEFVNLCGRETFEIPASDIADTRLLNNKNYLVADRVVPDYYDPTINGMNYGSTYEAGGCAVASSVHNGTVYLAVVFGGETETVILEEEREDVDEEGNPILIPAVTKYLAHALFEVKELLDWAKNSFAYFLIIDTADIVCEIPVKLGHGRSHITLFPTESIELYLPSGTNLTADIRTEYSLTQTSLTAPVSAGTVAGVYTVYYKGSKIAQVSLVTRSTVERSISEYYMEQIRDYLLSPGFLKWLGIGFGALVVYAITTSVWRHHCRKKALLRRRREKEEELRRKERERLKEWN